MINPIVSVLMTAYNREIYIKHAIESVLNSSFTNFELIIVDDFSSDNTFNIAKEYSIKDSRILLYKNSSNVGDYANRNIAARFASGKFIMHVDSDDMINLNGIELCVNLMNTYPKSNFGVMCFEKDLKSCEMSSKNIIRTHLFSKPLLMVGPGGTIIKRSFFNEINGFPEKYGPANDSYFNLKAASLSSVVLITDEFLFYRRHENQEINKKNCYLFNSYNYLKDALLELNLPLTNKEKEYLMNKNRRRFFVNLVNYYLKNYNLSEINTALINTKYTLYDLYKALFH